ncbi:M81 family metallopeptidase [soil metagenome]
MRSYRSPGWFGYDAATGREERMSNSRRVAIGMISHETNSFSPVPTDIDSFAGQRHGIVERRNIIDSFTDTKTGIGGFLEVGAEHGWEMIGTVAASATPSANVAASAHDALKGKLIDGLREAGALDGVLLHLHGAMLSENAPDAEGDICRAVREVIGDDVPLVVELDLHGNITAEFCDVVDGVIVYDTNPHIDAYERGLEAASLLAAILDSSVERPKVYISKPPMLPPTINMRTAEGPMVKLLERGREWESGPAILNVAVFPGFPYADFEDAGTSIVVTATDSGLGRQCADDMGRLAWEIRDEFLKPILPVREAVDRALDMIDDRSEGGGPVILADVADNPGGGGSGDTPDLIRELVGRGVQGAVACLWDPESVEQAHAAGVGAEVEFRLGGKASDLYGEPVVARGVVRCLSDGIFTGYGPVVRGLMVRCGRSALIDVNGLQIVTTTIRHAANDQGYFRLVGVQPEREPLLVIKSRGHFRADFEPISREIIEVDAPGAANPNLDRYEFQRLRRPIWPLDEGVDWTAG